MSVYVGKLEGSGAHKWCRLMGTNLVELEDFAVDIGVPASKVFKPREGPTFYALTERQRRKALERGAKERAG